MLFLKHSYFISILLAFQFASAFASEEIIKRKHYTLNYNEDHEIANWVSYELEKTQLRNCVKRGNNFKSDPLISTGSATVKDYASSGYDRGHLLPAGDMKFSAEAMSDTFFLSNITPQPANFNRVRWGQLENLMRSWAFNYNKIWIVTGPIIDQGLEVIGQSNSISVPLRYFKVILRKTGNSYKGIAFLMETSVPHVELEAYVTSINHIEKITKYDFFSFLDNKVEEEVEAQKNPKDWNFSGIFEYLPCDTSVIQ